MVGKDPTRRGACAEGFRKRYDQCRICRQSSIRINRRTAAAKRVSDCGKSLRIEQLWQPAHPAIDAWEDCYGIVFPQDFGFENVGRNSRAFSEGSGHPR